MKKLIRACMVLLLFGVIFAGCSALRSEDAGETGAGYTASQNAEQENTVSTDEDNTPAEAADLTDLPAFSGTPYVVLNQNVPAFSAEGRAAEAFESYSELDTLGRCGPAYANLDQELMPTEERGQIGQIKPSGWQTKKYDEVDGSYLYNRCHLIGYQLSGENANEKNLITGTRYMNVDGMLPFENMVADYIKETDHHVLYRVTPIYEGKNLLASGVQMEAESVEDGGEGIQFNVYVYNVQPGITIDYASGDSHVSETANTAEDAAVVDIYVLNTATHKFHRPSCTSVKKMKEENKAEYTGGRQELLKRGYEACKICVP
ncbi:MAG: DNA/RNA non-specific endonuclease [Lachnospiraceae bacterium]